MPGAEVELGLARSAPLTDGVGSVLDREVDSLPDEGMVTSTPSPHLPQRGNAYQPRASPWEPHPKE